MGWNYVTGSDGKAYPSGSSYSGGDGQVVHKVGTGSEITGSLTPFKGQSGFNTDDNKLYVYNGSAWRKITSA